MESSFDAAMILPVVLMVLGVLGYAVLAVFFPEWVGITGKKAQENLESHRDKSNDPKS